MSIQRYGLTDIETFGDDDFEIVVGYDPNGEYVRHADYKAEVDKLNHEAVRRGNHLRMMIESSQNLVVLHAASVRLAPWMSAAMDDPAVCVEMKVAVEGFLNAIEALEPKPAP